MNRIIKRIILALLLGLIISEVIAFMYIPNYKENFLSNNPIYIIKTEREKDKGIKIRFVYVNIVSKEKRVNANEEEYYMLLSLFNGSNETIDSEFEFNFDIKYKDEHILKNAKYKDVNTKDNPIERKLRRLISVNIDKEVYYKLKDVDSFSKDVYIRINDFKYKIDMKWSNEWDNNNGELRWKRNTEYYIF